ncbi:MAG TPA: GPW/gp25 family protein [Azospirillaceae bacterium]|nr:GPW/gp25 family protein [Azospirillaceae bacterium]
MARETRPGAASPSFLGTGWSFPPVFSRRTGSVVMVSGDADVKESLWILFSTAIGERIMLATYGTSLWDRVFTSLTTTTANQIRDLIATAILDWEPRIDVIEVSVTLSDPAGGILEIGVDYMIRQTNVRSNLVYPFYLIEATLPPPPY